MENGSFVGTLYVITIATALMSSAGATADMHTRVASESAMTRSDHEAMAISYENAALELQAKAQKKTQLLEQYQGKSYLYGRQAQDLQAHAHASIRKYDRAAKEKMTKADTHRQIAAGLEKNAYCAAPEKAVNC